MSLTVQIADTPSARATGLMNVKELSGLNRDGVGLPAAIQGAFWMKDTLIPLDIAFWDGQGIVVDVQQMDLCHTDPCPTYHSRQEYLGALEVNRGLMARRGVAIGDRLTLTRRP